MIVYTVHYQISPQNSHKAHKLFN